MGGGGGGVWKFGGWRVGLCSRVEWSGVEWSEVVMSDAAA